MCNLRSGRWKLFKYIYQIGGTSSSFPSLKTDSCHVDTCRKKIYISMACTCSCQSLTVGSLFSVKMLSFLICPFYYLKSELNISKIISTKGWYANLLYTWYRIFFVLKEAIILCFQVMHLFGSIKEDRWHYFTLN